ncbi:carbohydrate ABC transporter permease [Alkalibacterium pelagium]|uniref:Multiple sugar transport system permease protein n=1 Tax=Alkalibacterium pelagium TaxID=426702 RepID=A0A1H7HGJ4_9LACT|nr:carbohydrate ABC transporter permease [Alkalibacterium pelagium]GEN50480.1 ABC transporter permease [Alkalibacterium pelagium]SEK48060.1 multiple sugar transport system permease protein [Alkalibacterium pelagium]
MDRTKSFVITKWASYILLSITALIWLLPAVYAFTTSFKTQSDVMQTGFRLLPASWVMDNYARVLSNSSSAPIVRWFLNSVLISTTHTILMVIVVSLAAFGYARLDFKYRDTMFFTVLAISMFPAVVNIIPNYMIVHRLGWVNTPLAVIVPGIAAVGNVFLVRQFMTGLPKSYDESARMDGASDFTIYLKIIVPLIKPVLIVTSIFSFTGSWNDFLWPTIVLNDVRQLTITAGMLLLQDIYGNYMMMGQLMASAFLAMIPTSLLFLFAQKYFIESLNLNTGLKG